MRGIRCIYLILLLLILVSGDTEVFAMNTGFSTEELQKEQVDIFLANTNISIFTEEPQKKAIKCFDINEDGTIAIGHSAFDVKTIGIYTNDGDFQYGYKFKYDGDFGIEWDEDKLNIYFVRSDVAVSLNSIGEVNCVLRIQNTVANNSYWNDCIFQKSKSIGGAEYRVKNDMGVLNLFSSSYSQLVVTDSNSVEKVIYDVNSVQLTNMIITFVGVCSLICLVVLIVIRQFRRGTGQGDSPKTGDGSMS